jgi:hypothetical protein
MSRTVTQAAQGWGVSRTTVLEWIRNGRLTEGTDFIRDEIGKLPVYWIIREEIPPHRAEAFAPIVRKKDEIGTSSPLPPSTPPASIPPSPAQSAEAGAADEAAGPRKARRIIVR